MERAERILVIDDEPMLRMTIKGYLEDHGYEVREASNGREGMELFDSYGPDAVLVDLRMPEMDGLEVLQEVGARAPEIPVVVISGVGVMQDVIEALRRGAWDYLTKPVEDLSLVGHALAKTLERSRLMRENRRYRDHLEEEVRSRTRDLLATNQRLEREVEERREAEAGLRRYEQIVSATDDLLAFLDTDGRYRSVNRAFKDIFGMELEDIRGRQLGDILGDTGVLDDLRRAFARCLEGEKASYRAWFATTPLGRRYVDLRLFPYVEDGEVTGVVLYCRDMTNIKQAEEQLRRGRETERALLNAQQDPAYLLDTTGCVLAANVAGARQLGKTPETVHGTNVCRFVDDDCGPRAEHLEHVVQRGVPVAFQDECAGRHWDNTMTPLFGELGKVERVAFYSRDITAMVNAEHEAEAKRRQLMQADKLASIGTLVSGVAHEINNPTGVITLNAPMLADIWDAAAPLLDERAAHDETFYLAGIPYDDLRERVPFLLEQINESALRIKRIVAELKDFARQDISAMDQDVDLGEVVRTAVRLVSNKIKKTTHRFAERYAEEPVWVRGNAQRLEQVFVNALINACESLEHPDQAVEVDVACEGGRGVVLVRDEGKGIQEQDMPHLFDPFYTTKRDEGGTGLGLSVSLGIIQDHGGSMAFEPGESGVTLRVTLPAVQPDDGPDGRDADTDG